MKIFFNIIFLLFSVWGFSQNSKLDDRFVEHVEVFIDAVKKRNAHALLPLIRFPLLWGKDKCPPSSKIKDEKEFLEKYHEIFHDKLVEEIINSDINTDWKYMGWRGVMLFNGHLFIDHDGKLLAINYGPNDIVKDNRIVTDREGCDW